MNILCINHEYPPIGGGGANACSFLTKELSGMGNNLTIVTSRFEKLPLQETLDRRKIFRVKALRKKKEKSTFLEMFTFLISAFLTVRKEIKRTKYDICFIFFGIPSGPIGWYINKKYKIPYIIRIGGGDIPGAQKRFKFLYKILERPLKHIWQNSGRIIVNSEGLEKRARNFFDCEKIQVITNGVDYDYFCRKPVEKNKGIELLFVSRLLEGKGLQYIIPELKKIQKEFSGDIHLSIVGDGPYRNELVNITKESGAEDLVSFHGTQSKEKLLTYYSSADIFILPSKSEGMPNVVLEAMAMELPIIITPCEGSKELVLDNGIIAEYKDFAAAIVRLCKDSELRERMGKRSRELIEKNFHWKQIACQYESVLKDIVRQKEDYSKDV